MKISLIWIYELNAFCNLFQGELLCQKLDELSPETGPHKYYVAFRYASPLTEDTLDLIEKWEKFYMPENNDLLPDFMKFWVL